MKSLKASLAPPLEEAGATLERGARHKRLVVCVVGMPGSGKSLVSSVARELGFDVVVMGDAVRKVAEERGIEPRGEEMRKLMKALRARG